jgi:hypothetical protein
MEDFGLVDTKTAKLAKEVADLDPQFFAALATSV